MDNCIIRVTPNPAYRIIVDPAPVFKIKITERIGPEGPAGPAGPQGPPGPAGGFNQRYGLTDPGYVVWTGTGYIYDVGVAGYVIEYQDYISPYTQVTLAPADPTLDRIDVVYGDNTGTVGVITGTPAADPIKPQVDPLTQVEFTSILVLAGTTEPGDVTQHIIFNENLGLTDEWNFSAVNLTTNPNYAVSPYKDTKSILVSSYVAGSRYLNFLGNTVDMTEWGMLTFGIRLNAAYDAASSFTVRWYKANLPKSSQVVIADGFFNYDKDLTGWQVIQIPISAFTFSSLTLGDPATSVNRLMILCNGVGAGFQIDYVRLQTGIPSTSQAGVVTFNNRAGNVLPIADDYDEFFVPLSRIVTVNGEGGSLATDQNILLDLDDIVQEGNFTQINIRSANSFKIMDTTNTNVLGEMMNSSNAVGELYMYNITTGRQVMLKNNELEFKDTGSKYQVLKPYPTPTAFYVTLTLPNAASNQYIPISVNGNFADANGNIIVATGGSVVWGDITGDLSDQLDLVDALDDKENISVATTGSVISFITPEIYNSPGSPSSSNITDNLTGARIGVLQKIYHNKLTAPTFPAGWVLIGGSDYVDNVLNIIYCEWVSGTRVEYWITQEQ